LSILSYLNLADPALWPRFTRVGGEFQIPTAILGSVVLPPNSCAAILGSVVLPPNSCSLVLPYPCKGG